jgi:hypothetical protein
MQHYVSVGIVLITNWELIVNDLYTFVIIHYVTLRNADFFQSTAA